MTTESLSTNPEYRALVAAAENEPAATIHRLVLADWVSENTDREDFAAALRASADPLVECEHIPELSDMWHVRVYHDADRTAYRFVGVWPTHKAAVAGFVQWHMRGANEVQCGDCRGSGVCDSGGFTPWGEPIDDGCGACGSSGWRKSCEHDECDHPGEPCGGGYGDDAEPSGYFCDAHQHANGYCRMCRQFFGGIESFEFGDGFCDNCGYEVRNDARYDDEDEPDPPHWDDDYDWLAPHDGDEA